VIQGIVVEHEYRQHGIGYRLVEEVFKSCREKGVGMVRALVEENDARLRYLAEQLGSRPSTISNYDRILR
jgi:GNAT superfamily N-acetyltransferase